MRALILLAVLSLGHGGLERGSDSGYSNPGTIRSVTGSSASSIPAVLAVRQGERYSSTGNVLLRSEDISSILSSGNFVRVSGEAGITYAAIPVVRSGDMYSVAAGTLDLLRQSASSSQLTNVGTTNSADSASSAQLRLRDAASNNLKVSLNSVAGSGDEYAASAPASRDSLSGAYETVKSSTGARTDSSATLGGTSSYSSSVRATAPVVVNTISVEAASRDSSYQSVSSARNENASSGSYNSASNNAGLGLSVKGVANEANSDSISVSLPLTSDFRQAAYPSLNTRTEAVNSNTYSSVSISDTRVGSSGTSGVVASSASSGIGSSNLFGSTSSNTVTASSRTDAAHQGNVRTAIASAPGLKAGSLITLGLSRYLAGEPFVDFPIYDTIPLTRFSCAEQKESYGYYADVDAGCQLYHICYNGIKSSFLCPNGTLFNQKTRVCEWWFNVDCESSPLFYYLNEDFGRVSVSTQSSRAGADQASTNLGPASLVDSSTQTTANSPSVQLTREGINSY